MGKSGTGKTTIAKMLETKYGWKSIQSYTTRAPRTKTEKGHIFINPDTYTSFDDIKKQYPNRIAETIFDRQFYFATEEQADSAQIYIIDPAGVRYFKKKYSNAFGKKVFVVYLTIDDDTLMQRMLYRGDSEKQARTRIEHDKKAFKNAHKLADIIIPDNNSEERVELIYNFIQKRMGSNG